MTVDYKWQSQGGILLDGSGDIAFTSKPMESVVDMVRTRLKAAVDGWKLYPIGAGMTSTLGQALTAEQEVALRKCVQSALSRDFLPVGAFTVQTMALGETVTVFVYLNSQLIASASVNSDGVQVNS